MTANIDIIIRIGSLKVVKLVSDSEKHLYPSARCEEDTGKGIPQSVLLCPVFGQPFCALIV